MGGGALGGGGPWPFAKEMPEHKGWNEFYFPMCVLYEWCNVIRGDNTACK